MKKRNLILMPLVMGLFSTPLFACGNGGQHNDNELRICVYDGGYGTTWIEKLAESYEAKTGVKVITDVDQSILDRIEDQLENQSDYDIYMSHDINWQNFAARGLLANLDDLYEEEVEGTSKKFKDRLIDGALEMSKSEGENGEEHYYKVCFTQGAGGLVYNKKMFEENNWEVPTTYDELVNLCKTIVDAKIEVEGTRNTVVPFTWSGNERQYYWDYLVFEWWAQLAGEEKIDQFRDYKGLDGTVAKGYEVYDPNGAHKEFVEAYKMWYDLIALNSSYSVSASYSQRLLNAQAQFANGEAAMIPYGQWAKLEIEKAVDHKLDFDIAMMKTPKAKADSKDYNYLVGFGDSMIVPENTPNQELAKDFLNYMATYEANKTFVEETQGAFLAFDYSDVDLTSIEQNNTYIKSIHEKLTQTKSFHLSSTNPISYWNVNKVMPWVENTYYYVQACAEPNKYTPAYVGEEVYKAAKNGWPVWLRNAGL